MGHRIKLTHQTIKCLFEPYSIKRLQFRELLNRHSDKITLEITSTDLKYLLEIINKYQDELENFYWESLS